MWTVRADGLDERRLARGAHPDWSPDGTRIAFDRDGETYTARWWYGGAQRDAGAGTEPAYAPDGRLALVRDGQIVVGGNVVAAGHVARLVRRRPARVGARRRRSTSPGRRCRRGSQPAWPPARRVRELLPDFDQRAPSGLVIAGGPGRWLLGFTSLVDNLGPGSSVLVGVRVTGPAAHDRHAARAARERRGAHLRATSRSSATRTRRRTITGT